MSESDVEANHTADEAMEQVVEKVSLEHGFDVRGYKRSTLYRRIRKRIADAGCDGAEDYLVRLESDRHEYPQLVNTILINVTEFFRDPDAWECLQKECLEMLVRRKQPNEPLRLWSVGCATGEEPYSLAICLAELLGERSLRGLKIYATDVDEGALTPARCGVYAPEGMRNVSEERIQRFFEELPGGRFAVRRELRACVIFGRHNVLTDPPISRLDLLVCRNLLIYFDAETQAQLLPRFHYALAPEGYLFLGKAETLMSRSLLFRPVEPRFRLFQRVPQSGVQDPPFARLDQRRPVKEPEQRSAHEVQNYTLHALVEQANDPVLVLNAEGRLVMASRKARELLRVSDSLLGRSFAELDEAYRPPLLRVAIEDVRVTCRPSTLEELRLHRPDGSWVVLRVDLQPVLDPSGALLQIVLWGHDLTQERLLTEELTTARQELETVSEELQTTNEELETTNEELQSTNEELETTNEELQSTNEELETTIEELQSTNEELETANDELRSRQEALNALARYQDMVLSGLQMGLIVLDRNMLVTSWNQGSVDTWGVREDEAVGRNLFSLDIGLNLSLLRERLDQAMADGAPSEPITLDAINRRGRPVRCRIRLNPLHDGQKEVTGCMIMIESITENLDASQ